MKTARKVLVLALCAILLVSATIMGTMAYLTSQATVTNTFTVGNVSFDGANGFDEAKTNEYGQPIDENNQVVDLDEAPRVKANTYKLIPGHTYTKDPTIHMSDTTEDCYLFVKVEDGLADIEAETTIAAQLAGNGWTLVPNTSDIYAYEDTASASDDVPVFGSFTLTEDAEVDDYANAKIIVTAYAVQADGFDTAADAWNATFGAPAED